MRSKVNSRVIFLCRPLLMFGILLVMLSLPINVGCSKNPAPPLEINFKDPVLGAIGVTTATITITVTANFEDEITERGVCWDTLPAPTIQKSKLEKGRGAGTFTADLTGLRGATKYFIRSYAISSSSVVYGNEATFTTLQLSSVQTLPVSNISGTTATGNGAVVSDGGSALKEVGFCIDTIPGPDTTKIRKKISSPSVGSFSIDFTDLQSGKTYYVVAYALTEGGLSLGNEVSFKTAVLPNIITTPVSYITETSFITGGDLISDGGVKVLMKGVCWATTPQPNLGQDAIYSSEPGNFISTVRDLRPNTMYYVRAFAVNAAGQSYGQEVTVKTLPAPSTSISLVFVNSTNAILEAEVSVNGGTPISEKGICWAPYSTTSLPTVSNNKITAGSGAGKFSLTVSGLQPNTWYAARSYAKCEGGYFYSNSLTLATSAVPVLVTPIDKAQVPCCQVNFSWQSTSLYFEFELSKNADFSGSLNSQTFSCSGGLPATTGSNLVRLATKSICVSMPDLTFNGTWYWRVKVYDAYNPGDWSEVRSFEINN